MFKTLTKEQLKIRNYGENINRRAKEEAIEERKDQAWRQILEELNIPHMGV